MRVAYLIAACVAALTVGIALGPHRGARPGDSQRPGSGAAEAGGARHAPFVENQGQWDTTALFVAQEGAFALRAEAGVFCWQASRANDGRGVLLRFVLEGAEAAQPQGLERGEALHSFFLGNDRSRWHGGVPCYGAVRYAELLPGLTLVLRVEDQRPKFDLLAEAGVDPTALVVRVHGAGSVEIQPKGDAVLGTPLGPVRLIPGRSWQERPDGSRREIEARFVRVGDEALSLVVDDRDPDLPLVIDPELFLSSYIGTSGDDGVAPVALRPAGYLTVGAGSSSPQFPTTPGSWQAPGGNTDLAIQRYRLSDGALILSSVFGGSVSGGDSLAELHVSESGVVTATGTTKARDFPTSPGAFDPTFNGQPGWQDGYVLRLSADGTQLLYSTFLGGVFNDEIRALDVTPGGAAIVGGITQGGGFPTTPGSYMPSGTFSGGMGFITRFDPTGSSLEWSTFLGGQIDPLEQGVAAIDLAPNEDVLATGVTGSPDFPASPGAWQPTGPAKNTRGKVFATRLSSDGSSLVWSSVFGSNSLPGSAGVASRAIGIDSVERVTVTGYVAVLDWPTTPGALQPTLPVVHPQFVQSTFVVRLESDGSRPIYSTYLGDIVEGAGSLSNHAVVDVSGTITVIGRPPPAFPTTAGALDTDPLHSRAFVTRLSPRGDRLLYSTFLGSTDPGEIFRVAEDPRRRIVVGGYAAGAWPTTPNAWTPTYQGGVSDGVVTIFDALHLGTATHGESVPACRGPLAIGAVPMPIAGDPEFRVHCSGAAPLANGFLLIGQRRSDRVASALGLPVLVELDAPWRRIAVTSDEDGWCEVRLPLPASSTGERFTCQFLFRTTPACPGQGPWSSSNALTATVQP